MTGHSPKATTDAVTAQMKRGITAMLPTENAVLVSQDLTKRFGLPLWQFTVSATDANRHSIRYARLITGRSKIIVIDKCYHGSVDETFGTLDGSGNTVMRPGNLGAPVALDVTTRVVEFNNLAAMEAALAHGDVAAILMEPAMTNIGIVLPEEIAKVLHFTEIAGKAGKLGEHQTGDVTALNILHHAFGFRMFPDGFAALSGKVIQFFDFPATALGVFTGALLVMFGAVALGLVFGGNPNPDADALF